MQDTWSDVQFKLDSIIRTLNEEPRTMKNSSTPDAFKVQLCSELCVEIKDRLDSLAESAFTEPPKSQKKKTKNKKGKRKHEEGEAYEPETQWEDVEKEKKEKKPKPKKPKVKRERTKITNDCPGPYWRANDEGKNVKSVGRKKKTTCDMTAAQMEGTMVYRGPKAEYLCKRCGNIYSRDKKKKHPEIMKLLK